MGVATTIGMGLGYRGFHWFGLIFIHLYALQQQYNTIQYSFNAKICSWHKITSNNIISTEKLCQQWIRFGVYAP